MAESPGRRFLPSEGMVQSHGSMSVPITPTGPPTMSCLIRFVEVIEVARGDRPLPLEQLEPYMRGAKFAALALSRRHNDHDLDLAADAARYFDMAERYRQAGIATFRAKRERSQS